MHFLHLHLRLYMAAPLRLLYIVIVVFLSPIYDPPTNILSVLSHAYEPRAVGWRSADLEACGLNPSSVDWQTNTTTKDVADSRSPRHSYQQDVTAEEDSCGLLQRRKSAAGPRRGRSGSRDRTITACPTLPEYTSDAVVARHVGAAVRLKFATENVAILYPRKEKLASTRGSFALMLGKVQ